MDIGWKRIFRQIHFRCIQLIISCAFGYLFYVWFGDFQNNVITESSISASESRRNVPQGYSKHSEVSFSDEFGKKNPTLHPSTFSRFMDDCSEGWRLEVVRDANRHQPAAQLCRSNDGNGHWTCAPGWRKLSEDPFCVVQDPTLAQKMSSVLVPEYAPISDSRKLLFIHVPKAGGTTIETSFLFKEQREKFGGRYLGGHHRIVDYDKEYFESYHKFCIVRHPCSRLISVWNHYSQGLGNEGDQLWVHKFLDNFTVSSFDAFVERTLYPGGRVEVDNQVHLQTQVRMLFDGKGQFGLDQLLIFEKWAESMDELGKRINVNVTDLKSTHRLASQRKTCQESYTLKTWAKMTQIYEMDFCVFGYSTEFEKVNFVPSVNLTPEELTSRFHKCKSEIRERRLKEKQT